MNAGRHAGKWYDGAGRRAGMVVKEVGDMALTPGAGRPRSQGNAPPRVVDAATFVLWQASRHPDLAGAGARVQLARALVHNGHVYVLPERRDMPRFRLPNNDVQARGFTPGWLTHDYLVVNPAPASLRGRSGLALVGEALVADPTPGDDGLESAAGTRNDVGHLSPFDGGHNYVRSYTMPSTDPGRSRAIVNYTIKDEHAMDEGFVLRFARLRDEGSIELVTYGEGDAFKQSELFGTIWHDKVQEVWTENARAIFAKALAGVRT